MTAGHDDLAHLPVLRVHTGEARQKHRRELSADHFGKNHPASSQCLGHALDLYNLPLEVEFDIGDVSVVTNCPGREILFLHLAGGMRCSVG
jgi:hypothetical protein